MPAPTHVHPTRTHVRTHESHSLHARKPCTHGTHARHTCTYTMHTTHASYACRAWRACVACVISVHVQWARHACVFHPYLHLQPCYNLQICMHDARHANTNLRNARHADIPTYARVYTHTRAPEKLFFENLARIR